MKILSTIKEKGSGLLKRISNNTTSVYIIIAIVSFFMMWGFAREVSHAAEVLKVQHEKTILLFEIEKNNILSNNKDKVINLQFTILSKQGKQIKNSDEVLKMQEDLLRKLIQRLRDLGEWPPSPIDPRKFTI
jgi:hypothetical protein